MGKGPFVGNHELKCVYPYYRFFYRVDPDATRRFVEGFWNGHVRDWSTLLFNRHGEYAPWEHEYIGGPLPIIDDFCLSFINTGSDLIYAGALLSDLSGDGRPLLWAKRLLRRYDQIRDEDTGLGGYQFNHREPCRVRMSFKEPLGDRPDVNETTVLTNGTILTRYGRVAVTLLNLSEELGREGREFSEFVVRDLTALGKHSYDPSDRCFHAVLTDGTRLSPSDCMEGVGYCSPAKLRKVPSNGLTFLAYAKAYRLTDDPFLRGMVRDLALGMGWGDIFGRRADGVSLAGMGQQDCACALLGLMELYRATGEGRFLRMATDAGDQLLRKYPAEGFFTTADEDGCTHIDSPLPLALLHLAKELEGADIPTFYPSSASFDPKVIVARRREL